MKKFFFKSILVYCLLALFVSSTFAQRKSTSAARAAGSLTVTTGQPKSVIFINGVRHGVTNEQGVAEIKRVWAGAFTARVRSIGFTDWTGRVVIVANKANTLKVTQKPTTDEALTHYQKGEDLRDSGKNADAMKEFQQAVALRPVFPEARIAMVRSAMALQDYQEAEKQIELAKKNYGRPHPEAYVVLGNLRRNQGLVDEAIAAYKRAITLAFGKSFEAHIGLGIALDEQEDFDGAIKAYRTGIMQDMETEPILYYQLAEICEKAERTKEAIEAYQKYIQLDPEGEFASAAESVIKQLKEAKQ
ncbi:MAG: tetratricopeptide repeat protein [Acidobacteriota bacterium]